MTFFLTGEEESPHKTIHYEFRNSTLDNINSSPVRRSQRVEIHRPFATACVSPLLGYGFKQEAKKEKQIRHECVLGEIIFAGKTESYTFAAVLRMRKSGKARDNEKKCLIIQTWKGGCSFYL